MFQETTNDAEHFKFCSANICNHFFRLNFVNTLLQNIHTTMALPIHAALKKIPHLDITTGIFISRLVSYMLNGIR
jgi:UDP-N-acetylglucosamine pyrophosphorylase